MHLERAPSPQLLEPPRIVTDLPLVALALYSAPVCVWAPTLLRNHAIAFVAWRNDVQNKQPRSRPPTRCAIRRMTVGWSLSL